MPSFVSSPIRFLDGGNILAPRSGLRLDHPGACSRLSRSKNQLGTFAAQTADGENRNMGKASTVPMVRNILLLRC